MRNVRKWIGAAVAGLLVVAAVPAPEGEAYVESSEEFNLRRTSCGGDNDRLFLSLDPGVGEEGSGCGTLGGVTAGFNEAFYALDGRPLWADSYGTSTDGVPVILDASRTVTGTLSFGQFRGVAENPVGLGGGQTTVELTLKGKIGGTTETLGSAVGEALVLPAAGDYEVEFALELDDQFDAAELTSLTLLVVYRGYNVNQDFLYTEGRSAFTLPTFESEPVAEQ